MASRSTHSVAFLKPNISLPVTLMNSISTQILTVFLAGYSFQGLGSYPLYLKEALNKLFVSVHVFKAGIYKDAAETLTRHSMSEYSRQATQLLVDNLWQSYLETIARERGIAADDISEYIENYADILDDSGARLRQTRGYPGPRRR